MTFWKRRKKLIGIDIGASEIKLVEGRDTREKLDIIRCTYFPISDGIYRNGYILDDRKLSGILSGALEREKIDARKAHLSIKTSAAIVRTVTLPDVEDSKIDAILENHMEDYIPTDLSKYIIQYKDLGTVDQENTIKRNILIMAIPKEIVEMHFRIIKSLGLEPVKLDYQSNSILKLLQHAKVLNNKYIISDSTLMLLDLGYESVNVTLLSNEIMQITRVLEYNTGDRRGIDAIIERIENLIRYYTSQSKGDKIDVILLYGGLSKDPKTKEAFSSSLTIPIITFENLAQVSIQSDMGRYLHCIGSLITDKERKLL